MSAAPRPYEQDAEEDGDDGLLAEINVTPFVDVMLVLLIVFVVAAPLMVRGVAIDLPKAGGTTLGRPVQPLVVSLARDGGLFIRDERVPANDFDTRLQAVRADGGDPIVYVRADRGIAYGDVMDLIGRLGTAGFTRVSLLSQPRR